MRAIGRDQLDDLAVGAAILGTGGGGAPNVGKLLALQAVRQFGPVAVVDLAEVADDALVIPAGMIGAPTVMAEKLPAGDEVVRAVEALAAHLGRPVTHIVSPEAGGINSLIPFWAAARLGLPMVDADGCGRAFPEIQMAIMNLHGVSSTPLALADEKGNVAIIEAVDNRWAERMARSITVDMGSTALIALYPMSGREAREAMVGGTLSLCEELGRLVRETRAAHGNTIGAVQARLRGLPIFEGKIVDVTRETRGGFAYGETRLAGTGPDAGAELTLRFQNELLVASRDGEIMATVPDLIIVLDAETTVPITTEEFRYGFRVVVIGAPCDARYRSPVGLSFVGPQAFGYDVEYLPIEERFEAR